MAKSTIVWGTLCLEGASPLIHARKRSTVPNETVIGTVHWLIAGCRGWNTALTFTLLCACLYCLICLEFMATSSQLWDKL